MNRSLIGVMLVCITATSVFADSLDAGLGAQRRTLSPEQIAARSEQLEASTSFSLLRFPEARLAPGRIFKPEIWSHIEAAAREYDLDPMILAGMIFIESYGDPQAHSPTGPAGIAQMTKASARELGLSVGRKVRIGSKAVKKTRWVGKGKNRRRIVQTVQQSIYKTIDERYIPSRAITAMAKRLSSRRAWLGGKTDFAIAEYHMGAGRMAKLLAAYFDRAIKVSEVTAAMSGAGLSYPELFWTNTPYFRREVYQALDNLNEVDYSPTYYFRVRQAMRLLEIYRKSPDEYARLASAYQGKFGWTVLPSAQWSFVSEPLSALPAAPAAGVLHEDTSERFVPLPEVASTFGIRASAGPMAAERSTIGSALFVAHHLRRLQGDRYKGFEIARMLPSSLAGCASFGAANLDARGEDDECGPLHTLGWAFDVPTKALSTTERRDLTFILTDLRHAGLVAYLEDRREPTYHVVRHPDHSARFEQFYWDAMGGSLPSEERPPSVAEVAMPRMLLTLQDLLTRIHSYFA